MIDTVDFLGSSRKFIQMLNATVKTYENSLYTHMSSNIYRNFCLWGIDRENPSREKFLQIVGITQLARLTTVLLGDLAQTEREWQRFIETSMIMNAWQIYEIGSDNLAIGLAYSQAEKEPLLLSKSQLLCSFNETMILHLEGFKKTSLELEFFFEKQTKNLSFFEQSLISTEYKMLGEQYVKKQNNLKFKDLEIMLWAPLSANIMSCSDVVEAVDLQELNMIIRSFLILRYQSVNELLESKSMSFERFLEISTYTILVIPTLAYYVKVLMEKSEIKFRSLELIYNGILTEALYDAALIVRLLNDLGTPLIKLDSDRQKMFINLLITQSQQSPNIEKSFFEFISEVAERFPLLNRIQKDVIFGEVNTCLYNIDRKTSLLEAILQFEKNLTFISALYLEKRFNLMKSLDKITEHLYDSQISKLIIKFVRFHELIYSKSYKKSEGEYAIYNYVKS